MGSVSRAARRLAGIALLVPVAAFVIANLPPTRRAVASWAAERTGRALQARVHVGDLSYDLFRLSATARDVRIAPLAEGAAPWFEAERVDADVPWSVLRGHLRFQSIEVTRPRLRLEELRTWLDSRPPSRGRRLDRFEVERVAIREFALSGYRTSATFSIDVNQFSLEGTSSEGTLLAPVHAKGGSLRLGPYSTSLESADGTIRYDGQKVSLVPLRVVTGDHHVEANGDIVLLGQEPSWKLDVTLDGEVDKVLASWPAVPLTSGRAHVTGHVTGPLGSPALDLHGVSERLVFAGVEARDLQVSTTISGNGVAIEHASWSALGGRVEGGLTIPSGAARPDHAAVQWHGIDLAALLRAVGSPVRGTGRADGSATLGGRIDSPRSWQLDAVTRVTGGDGAAAAFRGDAHLTMDRGAWTLAVSRGRLGTTEVTLDARGRLPETGDRAVPRSPLQGTASVRAEDVAAALTWAAEAGIPVPDEVRRWLSGPVALDLALAGTVERPVLTTRFAQQAVHVRDIGTVTLDGPLQLTGASALQSDGITASLKNGQVTVAGSAVLPGALSLDVDGRDLDLVSLGRLVGMPDWFPRAGSLSARGRLTGTTRLPVATFEARARAVEIYGQHLDEISGPVRVNGLELHSDQLTLRSGEGRGSIRGTVDLAHDVVDLTGTATAFPLKPLSLPESADEKSGHAGPADSFDLGGTADLSLSVQGRLTRPSGSGRVVIADLRAAGTRPGRLEADVTFDGDGYGHVTVKVPLLNAKATGRIGVVRPWPFVASAEFDGTDIAQAAAVGGLTPEAVADITGTAAMRVRASGDLDRVADADVLVSLQRFEGNVYALPLRLDSPADIAFNASEISTAGVDVATGTTRARLEGRLARDASTGSLTLRTDGALHDIAPLIERLTGVQSTATGQFTSEITATGRRGAPRMAGTLDLHDATIQLQDRPAITGVTLSASLHEGRLDVATAHATIGDGTADASGSVPLPLLKDWLPASVVEANPATGGLSVKATLRNIAVGSVAALAGQKPAGDIDGTLDVTADLSADRLALDAVAGAIRVDRAGATIRDVAVTQVEPAEFRIRNGVASVDEWRWQGARTDLALRGSVGFTKSPVDYDLELRGPIDISIVGAVIPGKTAGHVRADISSRRVDGHRSVNGELVLEKGAWVDRDLQIALSDLAGVVRLRTDHLSVEGIKGRLNGGEVSITGEMDRVGEGVDYRGALSLTGRRVTIEYPSRVVNEVDADIRLVSPGPEGTPFGITGTATLHPGPMRKSVRQLAMMFASGPPVLPTPDVERRRALMAKVGLDVQIETAEDIVADSNEVRAQMGGTVRLTGTLASPGMLGRIDVRDDGELFLVGRVYKLRGGQIDFLNPNAVEPRLNIRGETLVSEYQVEMQVTGPVDRLDFRLRSVPPLSQGDLASLLVTGQTLKERREAAAGDAEAASNAARAQVLSAVSSEYLGAIGRWFGVDTVRIENSARDLSAVDIDPVSRLSVSKKLGPFFEVVYSQSIETNDDIYWVLVYDPGWKKLELAAKLTTQEGETAELRQELLLGAGKRPTKVNARARRNAMAPRVTDVAITGVPDAEAQQLKKRLSVSEGKRFDAFKWIRDRVKLEDFYRDQDRLRTTVAAARKPNENGTGMSLSYAIERGGLTRLRVEGYQFDGSDLQLIRTAWADSPIDEFVSDAIIDAARLALADDGYLQPELKLKLDYTGSDADAVLAVTPGERSQDREFAFTGNVTFASDRLKELLVAADLGAHPWVQPAVVVGPLESYYGAAGFLNVQITPGRPRLDGRVTVLPISIVEGQQFKVSAVTISGERQATEDELRKALGVGVGTVYTGAITNEGGRRLTDFYGRRGHSAAKVKVEPSFDRQASTVALAVEIDEGIRQVVDSVTTAGEDIVTRSRLIDRSIKVQPGKPVDSSTVELSQRRLYDLGTFSGVEPRFEPVGAPVQDPSGGLTQPVKVVFGLEEYPRYRLRYGIQVSTTQLALQGTTQGYTSGAAKPGATVDLRRSNVLGTGVDAGIGGFVTTDRYRTRGLLTSATLGGRQIQNTLSVTRDYQTISDPDVDIVSKALTISAEQRWRPKKRVELAYGYNLEYNDASLTYPSTSGESFPFLLSARLASLFSYVSYDTRDNILNATKGQFHSANLEVGTSWLASELGYASYLGQHFFFMPVGRKIRLASAARYGSVGILNSQEDSLEASFVRFCTGGGTTVRGYRQDDLTPAFGTNSPLPCSLQGGDVLLVLNQEVRYELWKWIELASFVDAGNTFATFKDFALSDLKVGVGAGLRLVTPFGVVRLDVGFPTPRPDHYPQALWYFSFGQAF